MQGDFANMKLYKDDNNNGLADDANTETFGAITVSGSAFTSASNAVLAAGTTNFLLVGDVSNVVTLDAFTVDLGTGNIGTITGQTTSATITPSGSTTQATHTEDTGNVNITGTTLAMGPERVRSRPCSMAVRSTWLSALAGSRRSGSAACLPRSCCRSKTASITSGDTAMWLPPPNSVRFTFYK